jgi:hypothetical protein
MKNVIEINEKVLEVAKDIQVGLVPNIKYEDILDCNDITVIDRDLLLVKLCNDFGYDLDWDEKLVITNKKAYDMQEFLLKLISNGRRYLKQQNYITL